MDKTAILVGGPILAKGGLILAAKICPTGPFFGVTVQMFPYIDGILSYTDVMAK